MALLYDPAGTDGETVFQYSSQPTVHRPVRDRCRAPGTPPAATSGWTTSMSGLAKVEITGGGAPPLLLLLADTNTAEDFWPETRRPGPCSSRAATWSGLRRARLERWR